MHDVIVIGGGLVGLIAAIELLQKGLKILVIEKKNYPFHKVCGEYISNEVIPYLETLGVSPYELRPSRITKFLLSSPSGKFLKAELGLGGFGISRYTFDYFLYQKALQFGAEIIVGKEADVLRFHQDEFIVTLADGSEFQSKVMICAYGKRSKIDKSPDRHFMKERSPYLGVKYHIATDFPNDHIALHNFKDGYCGISKVEGEKFNLCYLSHRNNLKLYKNIKEMEENILYKNPFLKDIFLNSKFLFEKPEVINEISFEKKQLVENHLLMVGDAAGMITPLCGNGMAMAIHGGKIVSECVSDYFKYKWSRIQLELTYRERWNRTFSTRLLIGRVIQRLFGKEILSEMLVGFFKSSDKATRFTISQTHGKVF